MNFPSTITYFLYCSEDFSLYLKSKQTKNTTIVCGLTRRNKAIIIHSSYVNSENMKCKYLINTNVSLANYLVIKSLYIVIQKTIAFLFTCNKLLKIIIFERDNL